MLDAPQHVQVSSKTFYRLKSIGKMYETLQKEYQNLQNENQTLLEENQRTTTENLSSQSTVAFQSPSDETEKMSFAEEIEELQGCYSSTLTGIQELESQKLQIYLAYQENWRELNRLKVIHELDLNTKDVKIGLLEETLDKKVLEAKSLQKDRKNLDNIYRDQERLIMEKQGTLKVLNDKANELEQQSGTPKVSELYNQIKQLTKQLQRSDEKLNHYEQFANKSKSKSHRK